MAVGESKREMVEEEVRWLIELGGDVLASEELWLFPE